MMDVVLHDDTDTASWETGGIIPFHDISLDTMVLPRRVSYHRVTDVELDDSGYHFTPSPLRSQDSPERILQKDQLEQAIQKSLGELPEELRLAITLRELEGMSYEDIAVIMD